jgi:hypothetical protein
MQSCELIAGTLGEDFDAAVVIVANPPRDAQDVRLPFDEPPEAYALDASANEEAAGMDRLFVRMHY